MKNVSENVTYCDKDEIDLRKLWAVLMKRKMLIVILTGLITFGAVSYALIQTPLYKAKAVLEIGSYSNYNNSNNSTLLENPITLVKRVEVNHIDNRDKKDTAFLQKVSLLQGNANLIELDVLSPSNEEALKALTMIENEIKSRHQNQLESYLSLMNQKIENLQLQKDELLGEKQNLIDLIAQKTQNIDKIIKDNSALAAVYTIELSSKSTELSDLKNKIYDINAQINDLSIAILPNNIKHTTILGKVTTYPIEPKKTLIVTVAFISGVIFSLFVVFFLEFIRKNKDE